MTAMSGPLVITLKGTTHVVVMKDLLAMELTALVGEIYS